MSLFNNPAVWGKGSIEVGPEAQPGESRIRRLAACADALVTVPTEGVNTVYDVFNRSTRLYGSRNAFGYRDIVNMVEEVKEVTKVVGGKEVIEKKKWKYFHLSDCKYYTFSDIKIMVSEIARGLLELGIRKGDVVNIYAQTRRVLTSHRCPVPG